MRVAADSTDVTTYFQLVDTSGNDATGLTIADLDMTYTRDLAAAVKADATALAAVDSVHGDSKMYEVHGTNAPGLYRADWPDAAFADGVSKVQLTVKGAAIQTATMEVEIGPTPADATKWNGTNVAAPDTAGYPVVTIKNGTGAGEVVTASGIVDAAVVELSTAAKSSIWNHLLASITTDGSIGKLIKDYLDAAISSRGTGDATASNQTTLANAIAALDDVTAAEVVTALLDEDGWTVGGSTSIKTLFKAMLAFVQGNVTISGNTWTFFDDDGATELFSFDVTTAGRS